MDGSIKMALEFRERLATEAVYHRLAHPGGDQTQSRAMAQALRSSQVVVWNKKAHEALSEWWDDDRHCLHLGERAFLDPQMALPKVARAGRVVRVVPELTGRSFFHFFPPEKEGVVGVKCPPQLTIRTLLALENSGALPPNQEEVLRRTRGWVQEKQWGPDAHNIASPCVASLFYHYDGQLWHACVYYPCLALKKDRGRENTRIDDFITAIADYHHPLGADWIDDDLTALTLYYHYQRQVFLEETFVGTDSHRARKHTLPTFKLQDKDEKVQVVYLRKSEPRIGVPDSFKTVKHEGHAWQLQFEVDVKGHWRQLRSGKVVWVREHKKGPLGVHRTRVVKAVR